MFSFVCNAHSKWQLYKKIPKQEKFNRLEHEKERSEGASSKEIVANKYSFMSFNRTPRKRSCI